MKIMVLVAWKKDNDDGNESDTQSQSPRPEDDDYFNDDKVNAGSGKKSVFYGYLVKLFKYFDEHVS